jgi:hypothetical protein
MATIEDGLRALGIDPDQLDGDLLAQLRQAHQRNMQGHRAVRESIRSKLAQLPRVDANGRPLKRGEDDNVRQLGGPGDDPPPAAA